METAAQISGKWVENTGGFPRIDSHQHFTREYLPSLLFPILKRNRFDGTVAVVMTHSVEESRWLLGLAAEHAFIRGVVCWADLADARVGDVLDEYQRHSKFRGVCWGPLPPRSAPSEPRPSQPRPSEPRPSGSDPDTCASSEPRPSGSDPDAGLAEIARRDLTLDLPPHFEIAARIAGKFPTLRVAIDHIGRPSLMEGMQTGELAQLARYPNLFVKISGLIADAPTQWNAVQFAPWVRAALAAFGADRVMYGSDWPRYLPVGTWKEALAAFTQALGPQTMETREHLLGATARRFYRLGSQNAAQDATRDAAGDAAQGATGDTARDAA